MRIGRLLRYALRPILRRPAFLLAEPWEIPQSPATGEDIFFCFRLLLGRPPNHEEWGGHFAQRGTDLDALVRSYMTSFEFSRRADRLLGNQSHGRVSLAKAKGFAIYVQEADTAITEHVKRDAYEPNVTAVFLDRLRPGMHVLDIGANIGWYTMLSASLVGRAGSVTAIEPNPDSAKLLEASRRANSFDNVTVLQVAAGRQRELLVLHGSYGDAMTLAAPDDAAALTGAMTVPSFKVDDLIAPDKRIDLVKIDVQGAEYNALLGASELIRRCHPTIVSEFSPNMMPGISGVEGREYLRFLLGFGYKISVIEGDGALEDCGTDADRVMHAYVSSGVDHIDILLD
jgi:FkbM family methyltransferase